jgi:hypothetical protein
METVFISLITLAVGFVAGISTGRFFCKWHHKYDEAANGIGRINGGAGTREYPPGHPLGVTEDVCGPMTIGDQIEHNNCGECTCNGGKPSCCEGGKPGCCKDE